LDTNTGTYFTPYIDVDVVRYNDKAPWPTNADGFGPSLERLNAMAYGNDPVNWRASPGPASPGLENTGNRLPLVNAGLDQTLTGTNFPLMVTLSGSATDDGQPNPPGALTLTWSQVSGPGTIWFGNVNHPNSTAAFPGVGAYVVRLTASDGALQASDDLTFTIQRSPSPVTFVTKGSVWKYLDDGSNQGTAWGTRTFTDSAWASGPAPLGYGDANGQLPVTTTGYGPDLNNKYITTYFRRAFTVSNPASVSALSARIQRDDGAVVYLNGVEVFRSNMPAGPVNYLTPAASVVGLTDETTFYSQPVDPSVLVSGANVLAVEIHQANTNSSDIIFDLELSGSAFPPNQGPSANAGSDQTITLPASAALTGAVSDDGLPIPPGLLTFGWTQFNGPGTVSFANANALRTTASFSTAGTYALRLTASDGASSVSDDLTVTVNAEAQPLRIESVVWSEGASSVLHIRFTAVAGQSYTVQCRDTLFNATWVKLADVPSQDSTQTADVIDSTVTNSVTRYYRIVTPQQP
jgi:hypothetical protein